jgi:aminoglycoside phosphotransferase
MAKKKTGQPRPLTTSEVHELLSVVAAEHGRTFALAGEMSGGDGPGAWALASDEGPAVLKMLTGRDAVADLELRGAAIDVLRGRGYPAPRLLCFGTVPAGTYVVQARLPGGPIGASFTPAQLEEILRLHDLHADIGVPLPGEPWPVPVTRPVLEGADGFCVIESMRAYSPETDAFLDELQQMTREHVDEVHNTVDLVHFDFTYSNILGENGRVTGVIDWEAAMTGDRGFDVATFAFYVFDDGGLRRTLLARAVDVSGPGAIRVYLAHIMFRQTEWCTRYYGDDLVRFYLRHSRTMLDELDSLAASN